MWQICLTIGIMFLILEIFVPSYFFLNLAIAAFICAILPVYFEISLSLLVIIFCVLSLALILVLRPLLTKKDNSKHLKTGLEAKYVGKTAKVVEEITKQKGVISIYDERWQARNVDDGTIEIGEQAEIVGYDSIVMKVKKAN